MGNVIILIVYLPSSCTKQNAKAVHINLLPVYILSFILSFAWQAGPDSSLQMLLMGLSLFCLLNKMLFRDYTVR